MAKPFIVVAALSGALRIYKVFTMAMYITDAVASGQWPIAHVTVIASNYHLLCAIWDGVMSKQVNYTLLYFESTRDQLVRRMANR